ncbi:MAG TPA: SDR family oxidoreductase [Ktedonobacteraceae bacterium]
MDMNEKVAIVTGGARGIGAATAKILGERGTRVIVNYLHNQEAAEAVVAAIKAYGGDAAAFQADVRDEDQVHALVAFAQATYGGRIDIVVNNANIPFAMQPFAEMSWSAFTQKVDDELKAAFLLAKAVLPIMSQQSFGRLIYVSAGVVKHPDVGMIAHGTAKGALNTFVNFIAQEFGPLGITANVVAPGITATDATAFVPEQVKQVFSNITPLRRIGEPGDVAGVIAFLASDDSRFVTGTYTPVDGGFTLE